MFLVKHVVGYPLIIVLLHAEFMSTDDIKVPPLLLPYTGRIVIFLLS